MAETPIHVAAIILVLQALQDLFGHRTDMFLGANMFWYFEQGQPKRRVSPEVLAAKGVAGNHVRRSFRTWEEGTVPAVTFEISSVKTYKKDLTEKRDLYTRLGVKEYFLFDPDNRYLKPQLQGFRLENGVSVPIAPGPDGGLTSMELGLRLIAEGQILRFIDPKTGKRHLTREEQIQQERRRRKEVKRRAEKERKRADELEAEVARLRSLLPPEARGE
jgi:Uma2 family endonuclease